MRYNVSLENFESGAGRAHLIRYYFARGFVSKGDKVIDAACGTGYGSQLLSEFADTVLAYDQVEKIKYNGHTGYNVFYQQVNLAEFDNFEKSDTAVSLETIEHLTKEEGTLFLNRLLPQVKRFFVFSVPLDEEPGGNPFHKQVFNRRSAWNYVIRPGWRPFHTLMQGNHLLGVMYRKK